jgi:arylsulfatase A-like enzyme
MDVHWPYHINAELEGCRELAQSWRDVRMMHVVSSSSAEPPAGWLDHVRLLYHAAIRRADAVIGRLLRDLRQRGWLENTVVALTSDHGEEFLEHGGLGHANKRLYEEIIRVPLIVAGPGICQGAVSQPVQLLDLAPTLLDLAQVDVPPDMLGRSLTPLLTGRSMAPSLPIISEMWWEDWVLLSARTDRHKLLWRPKMPDDYRFFDLASDPGEQVNVQGSAPRVEEDLLQSIRDHMGSVREGQEDAASVDLDQAVQDRLVALGYLEM